MNEEFWNKGTIIKVISNPNIPGSEEWLLFENEDASFTFKVFASGCKKFIDKKKHFNFDKFRPGKKIEIRINGHYFAHCKNEASEYLNEGFLTLKNKFSDEKYFVLGKVIKEAPENYEGVRGRLLKSRNLYVYFIDNEGVIKEGDNVILFIYGAFDVR